MFTIDLSGKTVVITGAGNGLAKETARVLADCGANLVIGDIDEAAAKASAEAFAKEYGITAHAIRCDITSLPDMEALFALAKDKLGKIDIVINGAGIACYKNLDAVAPDEIKRLIDINIMGVEYGCKLAYRYMKDQGHGKVVSFSSTAGRSGSLALPHYAMTKAAIINLTQSYALHAAPVGINYNCICPGIIRTDMWQNYLNIIAPAAGGKQEDTWQAVLQRNIPMGKPQEPIDIANAVAFLVSDQNRYITGQALNVCGGMEMN